MADISAPYNFVPLNKDVFFPPWANLVNHDVPFKEGLSGQIELEIKAESPIFIRKSYEEGDECYSNKRKEPISKEFCHIKDKNGKKQYFIPGSTFRNMIRSVVEIISFGKLNIDEFTDRRYGIRDFHNPDIYTLLKNTENIKIGYLIKEEDGYVIYDKGIPQKVKQAHIKYTKKNNEYCLKDLFDSNNEYSEAITTNRKGDKVLKSSAKTALFKYAVTNTKFDSSKENIVFTGQPAFNNLAKGKQNEFKIDKLDKVNDTKIKVSKVQFEDFKFIYGDYIGSTDISTDWEMWKVKLKSNIAIPVFFRIDDNEKLEDFGLAYLYKMAYKNRIEKAITNTQKDYNHIDKDLSQLIFGSINNEKLKGRVQINHAFCTNAEINENEYKVALSNPKASYYPFYIEQTFHKNSNKYKISGEYKTFNDDDVKIQGRKKYPLHDLNLPTQQEQNRIPNNVATFIKPLKEGSVFNTKVVFHNLLPQELGAILSAITFHNNNNCRHSIGAGKPMGLGQVKLKPKFKYINDSKVNDANSQIKIKEYLKIFEEEISKKITDWSRTSQIIELCTMNSIIAKDKFKNYAYMKLVDFPKIKKDRKALPNYSIILEYEEPTQTLCDSNKVNEKENKLNEKDLIQTLLENINNKLKQIKTTEIELKKGLIILENDNLGEIQIKINKFKELLNLDDNQELPLKEHEQIINKVNELVKNKNKKFRVEFKLNIKSNLTNWIGEEKATVWYNSKEQ